MLTEKEGRLKEGELVKGRVKKILPQCAFLELESYENKKGTLHISNISSSWVKDIKDEIGKGEELICKVIEVNEDIELSLKAVSEEEKLQKEREESLERRAEEILKAAAKKADIDKEEIEKIEKNTYGKSRSLYGYLELAKEKGVEIFKEVGASKELIKSLEEVLKERRGEIKVKERLKITSLGGNGIKNIKEILSGFESLETTYLGAPRYLVKLKAEDYKTGQKELDKIIEKMKEKGRQKGVSVEKIKTKK